MGRDLDRVARYVIARRGELELTHEELADRAGVDRKTIYNLESGERWPRAMTRGKLEKILLWRPGTIEEIARGGEPGVDPGRIPTSQENLEAARQDIAAINRLLTRASARQRRAALAWLEELVGDDGADEAGTQVIGRADNDDRGGRAS